MQLKELLVGRQRGLLLRGDFAFFTLSRDVQRATASLMAVSDSTCTPSLAALCIRVSRLQPAVPTPLLQPLHHESSQAVPPLVPTPPVPTPPQLPQQRRSGQQRSQQCAEEFFGRQSLADAAAERAKRLSSKHAARQQHAPRALQQPHPQPVGGAMVHLRLSQHGLPSAPLQRGSHHQHMMQQPQMPQHQPRASGIKARGMLLQHQVPPHLLTSVSRQHLAVSAGHLTADQQHNPHAQQPAQRQHHQQGMQLPEQSKPNKLSGSKRGAENVMGGDDTGHPKRRLAAADSSSRVQPDGGSLVIGPSHALPSTARAQLSEQFWQPQVQREHGRQSNRRTGASSLAHPRPTAANLQVLQPSLSQPSQWSIMAAALPGDAVDKAQTQAQAPTTWRHSGRMREVGALAASALDGWYWCS